MSQEEIRVKLPKHLAIWLQEFSKAIAMTPDQLLANILNYYYEAWRIGAEGRVELGLESPEYAKQEKIEALLEEYTTTKRLRKNKHVLKKFMHWIESKGYRIENISDDHINEFLKEYSSERKLKTSTIYLYKGVVKRFVEYVRSKHIKT
ncbi:MULTISPECIES: hypothetical protein [Thermoprotei]|uniref:hypothetical protein n=1 Tax=Thermoprotei TaxID=183924 RepID=UPI0031653E71